MEIRPLHLIALGFVARSDRSSLQALYHQQTHGRASVTCRFKNFNLLTIVKTLCQRVDATAKYLLIGASVLFSIMRKELSIYSMHIRWGNQLVVRRQWQVLPPRCAVDTKLKSEWWKETGKACMYGATPRQ